MGARVRFGSRLALFPDLGAIVTGDHVEPVGRSVDGLWILIRFRDGFGWIARDLLVRLDINVASLLPVLLPGALTPSATFTATRTPTITPTQPPARHHRHDACTPSDRP